MKRLEGSVASDGTTYVTHEGRLGRGVGLLSQGVAFPAIGENWEYRDQPVGWSSVALCSAEPLLLQFD